MRKPKVHVKAEIPAQSVCSKVDELINTWEQYLVDHEIDLDTNNKECLKAHGMSALSQLGKVSVSNLLSFEMMCHEIIPVSENQALGMLMNGAEAIEEAEALIHTPGERKYKAVIEPGVHLFLKRQLSDIPLEVIPNNSDRRE